MATRYVGDGEFGVTPVIVPRPQKSAGKKFAGWIILLLFAGLIATFIGMAVYFYNRPVIFKPLSGGEPCSNGSIAVPKGTPGKSPPDGVACYTLDNYNVYPNAVISSPIMQASDQTFSDVSSYSYPGMSPIDMTGDLCTQLCNETSGCVAASCKTPGAGITDRCSCTGYKHLPAALAADNAKTCITDGQCGTVYIKSSAI